MRVSSCCPAPMIREGSIPWNAAAEIISTGHRREKEREKERQNDARAAKEERRREKKNSLGGEKRGKRRAEKKPSSHRANEPIFSHLARPDGRMDGWTLR